MMAVKRLSANRYFDRVLLNEIEKLKASKLQSLFIFLIKLKLNNNKIYSIIASMMPSK